MPKESCKIFLSEGVEGTKTNQTVYTLKNENGKEVVNHDFWRKISCLVAIKFTSLKVSMTASKVHLLSFDSTWLMISIQCY